MLQMKQSSSASDDLSVNGGGESLHAGLLTLDHARLPPSRISLVQSSVILSAVARLRETLRPNSYSSPPYLPVSRVDPHNHADGDGGVHRSPENDVRITISPAELESLNLLADTGDDDAAHVLTGTGTSDNPNNEATSSSSDNRTNVGDDTNASDRSLLKSIMSDEDLNRLRDLGWFAAVLNSDLESGLGSAGLREEVAHGGAGAKSQARYLIEETKSWKIRLLLLAGCLSMVTGLIDYGATAGWHDSLVIFIATLLLILIPSLTKFREAKELANKMQEEKVQVIRDGRRQEIAACSVVEGELVILEVGVRVPGDGLLIEGTDQGLAFDVAPNEPFLRYGSKVVCGTGRMMVTSSGCDTKIGELMRKVNCDPNAPSCLLSCILVPLGRLDTVLLCFSILVLLGIFIHFRHKDHDKSLPEMKGEPPWERLMSLSMKSLLRPRGLVSLLVTALSTLPMAFQQGVPLTITSALACWTQKVKKQLNDDDHHVDPQNLSACASMGFSTVICFDISGELVLQLMEIGKFIVGDREFTLGEESNDAVRALLQQIGLSIDKRRDSRSPVDSLIEPLLQPRTDVNEEEFRANIPFARKIRKSDSGKEVLLINRGQDILHWRIPAERILGRCSHYHDLQLGDAVPMSDDQRKHFSERVAQMVCDGLHPIALAYKKTPDQELMQSNLILFAIIVVKFQEETISTIEAFQRKGVSIKLISEDPLDEVRNIFSNLGMLEGKTFRCLEENVRNERINEIMVMEKCIPLDKIQMLQCLKHKGNVVAFYGGGAQRSCDAPSLREADVGLVSEDYSSEITKEASDIIMGGGRGLISIYSLWNCCRAISNNLQKFTALQFNVCISGLIITSVSSLVLGDSAMSTIEVIWANLVICILGGLMMRIKLPNSEMNTASDRLLCSRTNPLTKGMWMNFVIQVLYEVLVLMFILFEDHITGSKLGISQNVKNTFVFNSFVLCQVVNVLNTIQLDKKQVFLVIIKSYTFLASLVAILIVQIVLVQFMGRLVNFPKLNFVQWLECFSLALLPWACRALFPWVCRLTLESLSNHGALFLTSVHRYSSQFPYIGMLMIIGCSWYMLF